MFMMSAILLQGFFAPEQEAENGVEQVEIGEDGQPLLANKIADDADSESNDGADDVDEDQPAPVETQRTSKDEFVSFGSLAPDGSDRYLIVVNKRGGTIHRIELNFRDEKGRYKYRDIVWKGGYLGNLECETVDEQTIVRVVGAGTPAEAAGIKVGDVVVSLGGQPIICLLYTSDAADE